MTIVDELLAVAKEKGEPPDGLLNRAAAECSYFVNEEGTGATLAVTSFPGDF